MTPPNTPSSALSPPPRLETDFFTNLRGELKNNMETQKVVSTIQNALKNLKQSVQNTSTKESTLSSKEKEIFLQEVEAQITSLQKTPFASANEIITALEEIEENILLAGDFVRDELNKKVSDIKQSLSEETNENEDENTPLKNSQLYNNAMNVLSKQEQGEPISVSEQASLQKLFYKYIERAQKKNPDIIFDFSDENTGKESMKNFLGISKEKEVALCEPFIQELYNSIPLPVGSEKEKQHNILSSLILQKRNGEYQLVPYSKKKESNKNKESEQKGVLLPEGVDPKSWNTFVKSNKEYNNKTSQELNDGGLLVIIMRTILNAVGVNLDQVVKTNTTLGTMVRQLSGVSTPQNNTNPLKDEGITTLVDEKFINTVINNLKTPKYPNRAKTEFTNHGIDHPEIQHLMTPLLSAYSDISFVNGYTKSRNNPPQISFKLKAGSKESLTTIFSFLTPSNSEQALKGLKSEMNDKWGSAGDAFQGVINFANEYGEEGGVLSSIFPASDKLPNGIPEFNTIKKQIYGNTKNSQTNKAFENLSLTPNSDGTVTIAFLGEKKQTSKASQNKKNPSSKSPFSKPS